MEIIGGGLKVSSIQVISKRGKLESRGLISDSRDVLGPRRGCNEWMPLAINQKEYLLCRQEVKCDHLTSRRRVITDDFFSHKSSCVSKIN